MSKHAFFIAGDRVMHIANPQGAGFQYRAQQHVLLPRTQVAVQRHEGAETVIFVQEGVVEVMINGAAALVGAGSYVSAPAGVWFAYRNVGDEFVRLLIRKAPPSPVRDRYRITIHLTAA